MRKFDNGNGYNDGNPYYSPEKCGLEIVADADLGASYEFDIFVLFRDIETGRLFFSHDSGCSCPVPFEDVRGLDDMTEVHSLEELVRVAEKSAYGTLDSYGTPDTLAGFYSRARKAFA